MIYNNAVTLLAHGKEVFGISFNLQMYRHTGVLEQIGEDFIIGKLKNEEKIYLSSEPGEDIEEFLKNSVELLHVQFEYESFHYDFFILDEMQDFKSCIAIVLDNKATDLEDIEDAKLFKKTLTQNTSVDLKLYDSVKQMLENEKCTLFTLEKETLRF